MAGAMDMAAKLPKIRDEEREQRVSSVDIVTNMDHDGGHGPDAV